MRWEWAVWLLLSAALVLFILAGAYLLTCSQDPLGEIHTMCKYLGGTK